MLRVLGGYFCVMASLFSSMNAFAAVKGTDDAVLIIGASYVNGTTRLDDKQLGSLGGLAVGSGSYLSLGDALVRQKRLNGLVVNEGSVGSTTFDRFSCLDNQCLPFGKLLGYEKQFENALKRSAVYDPENPGLISRYNTKYLVIGTANDCIHSDAFGIPQNQTQPCSMSEINSMIDIIIGIARSADELGIKVIIPLFPKYEDLDLEVLRQGLGFHWVIDEVQYNLLRDTYRQRLETELENAYIVDVWKKFTHRGDGIHPDRKTVKKAARKVAKLIQSLE